MYVGKEGRQAESKGMWKDKAGGEGVAGFKGCQLVWPRRSHEVCGCEVCWVFWNRLAVSGHAFVLSLSGPATDWFPGILRKADF